MIPQQGFLHTIHYLVILPHRFIISVHILSSLLLSIPLLHFSASIASRSSTSHPDLFSPPLSLYLIIFSTLTVEMSSTSALRVYSVSPGNFLIFHTIPSCSGMYLALPIVHICALSWIMLGKIDEMKER